MQASLPLCLRAYFGTVSKSRSPAVSYIYHGPRPWSSSTACRAKRPANYRVARRKYDLLRQLNEKSGLEDYYIPASLAKKLREFGFRSIPMVVKLFNHHRDELERSKAAADRAIKLSTTNQQWIRTYEEALSYDEIALLTDPKILPRIFEAFGEADFHRQNRHRWSALGHYTLCAAFEAGDVEAALKVAFLEYRMHGKVQRRITEFIKQDAMKMTDWRTMTVWLFLTTKESHSKAVARDNYIMAKKLDSMLEPSNRTVKRTETFQQYQGSWYLVFSAANHYLSHFDKHDPEGDPVQEDLERAVREGVEKWKDPEAAHELLLLPNEVKKFSDRWVSLMTESAVDGSGEHCVRLALYHLARDGWLSHHLDENDEWVTVDRKEKPKSWVGIEWLGLSAALENGNASIKTKRYLRLALLLREHGLAKEALPWFSAAKSDLQDQCIDPDEKWVDYIDGFEKHWFNDEFVTRSSEDDWFLEPDEDKAKTASARPKKVKRLF
nr:hypothetical protein LTR18_009610 [Exophiala xenobiotica]